METYHLLTQAPPHDTPEFLDFLRENNPVVHEDQAWLIIENCKYHTEETPWHTAFYKYLGENTAVNMLVFIPRVYWDWEWLKKAKVKQTVGRFHIHLIKK